MRRIEARPRRIEDRTRRIENRTRHIEDRTRHIEDRHRNGGPRKYREKPAPPAAWLPHGPVQRPRPPLAISGRPKRMHPRLETGLFHRLPRIPELPGVPESPRAPGLPRVPDALAPRGAGARDDGASRHLRAMTGLPDPRSKPAMAQLLLRRASRPSASKDRSRLQSSRFCLSTIIVELALGGLDARGQPFVKPR